MLVYEHCVNKAIEKAIYHVNLSEFSYACNTVRSMAKRSSHYAVFAILVICNLLAKKHPKKRKKWWSFASQFYDS